MRPSNFSRFFESTGGFRNRWDAAGIFRKDRLPKNIAEFFKAADAVFRWQMPFPEAVEVIRKYEPLLGVVGSAKDTAFWRQLCDAASAQTKRRHALGGQRSLWGVTPIVSLNYGAEADRRLGLVSETLVFTNYYVTSDFDINLTELQSYILANCSDCFVPFRKFVLGWALLNYDIFHLYNDRGLIEPAGGYGSDRFGISISEMKTYRATNKALFTYAYGADHRLRNKTLNSAPLNFCMDCPEPGKFCVCDDEGGGQMLETIAAHATRMIGFGLAMKALPNAYFLPYLVVDLETLPRFERRRQVNGPLRVGHFPNSGFFKGTSYLQCAIDELKSERANVEIVYFSGVPRQEILAAMQDVDVVVDQLISGAFGLTGVEAMALGRPVIAHVRHDLAIPARSECPVIEATPDTIKDVLAGLAKNRSTLELIGQRGHRYVEKYLSISSLSEALRVLYKQQDILRKGGRRRHVLRWLELRWGGKTQ